jgi:hypothetical protein
MEIKDGNQGWKSRMEINKIESPIYQGSYRGEEAVDEGIRKDTPPGGTRGVQEFLNALAAAENRSCFRDAQVMYDT